MHFAFYICGLLVLGACVAAFILIDAFFFSRK